MTHPDEWPFSIISEYTLNPQHLADTFLKHAEELEAYLKVDFSQMEDGSNIQGEEDFWIWLDSFDNDDDALSSAIDDLMDFFTSLCPEGYYFGAHPDDGACFGYWKVDDD